MFVIRLKFGDAQSLSYALKRLYFTVVKCFCEKLIWPSNIRNFDILKCLLWLKFRNAKSLTNALKRIVFTVLKNLIWLFTKNLIDRSISEILTTWNICYNAQLSKCSIACLPHQTLSFYGTKISARKLIWQSNFRKFDILKCLLYAHKALFYFLAAKFCLEVTF